MLRPTLATTFRLHAPTITIVKLENVFVIMDSRGARPKTNAFRFRLAAQLTIIAEIA